VVTGYRVKSWRQLPCTSPYTTHSGTVKERPPADITAPQVDLDLHNPKDKLHDPMAWWVCRSCQADAFQYHTLLNGPSAPGSHLHSAQIHLTMCLETAVTFLMALWSRVLALGDIPDFQLPVSRVQGRWVLGVLTVCDEQYYGPCIRT